MNVSEFLLARIAEDEAVARSAIGKRVDVSATWSDFEVSRHIDRWSSARVLADCEAKRRIVAWCSERNHVAIRFPGSDPTDPANYIDGDYAHRSDSPVLRLLALPYVDHPGYRQEWRP